MITGSVGLRGKNAPRDVTEVQSLLAENRNSLGPVRLDMPAGRCDSHMVFLIEVFQRQVVGMNPPTGLVEPKSRTWYALTGQSGPATSGADILDDALLQLESTVVNFSERFIGDARIRGNYVSEARAFSEEVVEAVRAGHLTPKQGAERAHLLRNSLLDAARLKSSDVGRAVAEAEKATGLTITQLMERYAKKLFKRNFAQLTAAEQDEVFIAIVRAAGRPNQGFTAAARNLGRVGRGLIVVSLAFSAYSVATSDRPGREAVKQGGTIGIGFLGSMAGGAVAGLACGPGAPVCVGVGALIGGVAFALGADITFDWMWE
jgi:hypothetical protein